MAWLITHGVLTWGDSAGEIPLSFPFFPSLVVFFFFVTPYVLANFTMYGMIYFSWINVIFSLGYIFKPFLPSNLIMGSGQFVCVPSRALRNMKEPCCSGWVPQSVWLGVFYNCIFLLLNTHDLYFLYFGWRYPYSLACLTTWWVSGCC